MDSMERLLDRFKAIAEDKPFNKPEARFRSYAVSNFRGGIGKTTLTFNLAYETARRHSLLLMDVCPQRSLSELVLGEDLGTAERNVYDALLPKLLPAADVPDIDDLLWKISVSCPTFKGTKVSYSIPGSADLFLFPSTLYSTISNFAPLPAAKESEGINRILSGVQEIYTDAIEEKSLEKVIIDTSPFFGGATHLAWCAVEALIIPVRVDQQSVDALRLTLDMLKNEDSDFNRLNKKAGRDKKPKVHAIAMTHCGWSRQGNFLPDLSTKAFVAKVLDLIQGYEELFSTSDPVDSIFLLDDFHSAGRISGSKRTPLSKLEVGQMFTIEGQRLQVNESLERYQKEVRALASIL